MTTKPIDLDSAFLSLREVNAALQAATSGAFRVLNPGGEHALACGLDAAIEVTIDGHAGYYCGGMNKHASITVSGNAGTGCAENIMSGAVRVRGDVSQSLAATGHGGLVVVEERDPVHGVRSTAISATVPVVATLSEHRGHQEAT